MGFFDLFKTKEELICEREYKEAVEKKEKREREEREEREKEEREKREWDKLSDREKINKIKEKEKEDRKEGEEADKKRKKWEEMKSTCINRIIAILKQHPGEYYTEKMILDIVRPQNEEERSCYVHLLKCNYDQYRNENKINEDLEKEHVLLMEHHDTKFYYYPQY